MKKIQYVSLFTIFLVSSFAGALSENNDFKNIKNNDFTHTVFIEDASTTWCPNCPNASRDLYSIYESEQYPFYFVTLLSDVNRIASRRMRALRVYSIPAMYIDGGYSTVIGDVGEEPYKQAIEDVGYRDVNEIEINTTVNWDGDAKIMVTATVTNKGDCLYFGILRSYVTEIESRWLDYDGNPFHFGFLDFAINKLIVLGPQKSITKTVTWDGAKNHGGLTFEDITEDNIMVISTVSHWKPHISKNDNNKIYLAFYVDNVTGSIPP